MTSAYKDTNYQATSKKSRKINVNPNKMEIELFRMIKQTQYKCDLVSCRNAAGQTVLPLEPNQLFPHMQSFWKAKLMLLQLHIY